MFYAQASEWVPAGGEPSASPAASSGDMEVVYRFGYCTSVDCGNTPSGSPPSRVWLSGWQPARSFDYSMPLLPPGDPQPDGSHPRTVVMCAAHSYMKVVQLSEVCTTETISVVSPEPHGGPEACFQCLVQGAGGSTMSYLDTHQCALSALACTAASGATGAGPEQHLLDALVAVQSHLDGGSVHSGVVASSLEVIRAISDSTSSLAVVANAAVALRWASLNLVGTAAGDPEGLVAQANTVLSLMGSLQVTFEVLRAELLEGPNYMPTMDCGFTFNSKAVQETVARAVLSTLHPGAAPLAVGGSQMRQLLGLLDTTGVTGDMTFQLTDPSDATGEDPPQRHRRFLQASSPAPLPEVALPRNLATACNAAPLICPQPVMLKLSYIHDSTYLLMSLGRELWVTAAARYAGVPVQGLRADLVSGQMGVELVSMPNSSLAMLGSWATLQFPIDRQVTGATLSAGKLCARIDYSRMVPVITEQPTIVNGTIASCTVDSEGDYVVVQLSYGTMSDGSSGGKYTSLSRDGMLDIYDTAETPQSKYLFSRANMARFEVAVAVMVLLALALVAVMILRGVKTLHEDPFADETQPGSRKGKPPQRSVSRLRRQLGGSSGRWLTPTSSRRYLTVAYDEEDEDEAGITGSDHANISTGGVSTDSGADLPPRPLSLRNVMLMLSPVKQMQTLKRLSSPQSSTSGSAQANATGRPSTTDPGSDKGDEQLFMDELSSRLAPLGRPRLSTAGMLMPRSVSCESERQVMEGGQSRPEGSLSSVVSFVRSMTTQSRRNSSATKTLTQRLLDMDARGDRDQQGNTALHIAAGRGSLEAVQALLDSQEGFADVRHLDYQGRTPVHTAARAGHVEVLRVLLLRGLQLGATPARSRMLSESDAGNSDSDESQRALYARGPRSSRQLFSVNKRDSSGLTALHHAAQKGHAGVIAQLQEVAGDLLDVDCMDKSGSTALLLAVQGNHEAAVEQLLASNPAVDDADLMALHESVSGSERVSVSPLNCAMISGKFRMVRLLLQWLRQKEKAGLLPPQPDNSYNPFSDMGTDHSSDSDDELADFSSDDEIQWPAHPIPASAVSDGEPCDGTAPLLRDGAGLPGMEVEAPDQLNLPSDVPQSFENQVASKQGAGNRTSLFGTADMQPSHADPDGVEEIILDTTVHPAQSTGKSHCHFYPDSEQMCWDEHQGFWDSERQQAEAEGEAVMASAAPAQGMSKKAPAATGSASKAGKKASGKGPPPVKPAPTRSIKPPAGQLTAAKPSSSNAGTRKPGNSLSAETKKPKAAAATTAPSKKPASTATTGRRATAGSQSKPAGGMSKPAAAAKGSSAATAKGAKGASPAQAWGTKPAVRAPAKQPMRGDASTAAIESSASGAQTSASPRCSDGSDGLPSGMSHRAAAEAAVPRTASPARRLPTGSRPSTSHGPTPKARKHLASAANLYGVDLTQRPMSTSAAAQNGRQYDDAMSWGWGAPVMDRRASS